jgi:hypothetical protein
MLRRRTTGQSRIIGHAATVYNEPVDVSRRRMKMAVGWWGRALLVTGCDPMGSIYGVFWRFSSA